jgi:HSP20 family protein
VYLPIGFAQGSGIHKDQEFRRLTILKTNKTDKISTAIPKSNNSNMPIVGFDPFGSFFDDVFERSLLHNKALLATVPRAENQQLWQPHGLHVQEDDKSYSIFVDVPGVKVEDMNMQLVGNNQALHLSGGRKFQNGDTVEETKFERRFTIASDIDVEKIKADLSNGVLTITAPKKEPEKESRRIITITEAATSE